MEDKTCVINSQNLDDERKLFKFAKKQWRTFKLQATNMKKTDCYSSIVSEKIKDFECIFDQPYGACKKIFDLQHMNTKKTTKKKYWNNKINPKTFFQ